MGDANVRRPLATRFEHGVDFGLLVHKSPFMADKRDPLVLSNYIFELLEVNPGVAGFLIQLHTEDVDAVVESVTAHAEKGAGTKTTLYVGQEEEEEEVEEEEEDAGGVGAGGMGCSVLGRGAEPLVRTQFLEHPPTLNFGANHLKKWIQHPQKPPIPFLSPHNPHHGGGFWGGGQRVRAQLEQS